jgi:hypothetical protein
MTATMQGYWKRALRGFSIEHLWCLTALAGIFVFLSTHPIRPHDFWWHIEAGREIVSTGQIPTVDAFSFTTPGRPYIYWVYWLMESALYILYSLGGAALVVFTHSLVITATYSLLLWLCWRLSRSWRVAAFCTLYAAAMGLNNWNVRPQIIAFPLSVLFLWAIYEYRLTPRRRWLALCPSGMLVWVNSHGSFVLGLLLLGIWLVEEGWQVLRARLWGDGWAQIRRLLPPGIALAVSALACLINPRGLGIISYLNSMSGNPVVQNLVPEWATPSFDSLSGSIFLVALLLSATVLILSPHRPTFFQLLTFLSFTVLSLRTLRVAAWFGIATAPVLADHLPSLVKQALRMGRQPVTQPAENPPVAPAPLGDAIDPQKTGILALNYFLAGTILIVALLYLPWFKARMPLPENKADLISTETPIEATRFLLRERLPGPLFHDMAFGSYLIWAAQPEYPVFVDPRIDLYPPKIWRHYLEISEATCYWEQRVDQYGINTLMLSSQGQPALIKAAQESPNWRLVHQDPSVVFFVREPQQ